MIDIGNYINIASPEGHCNQDHDHLHLPWGLANCPWQKQLEWQMNDTGFNEGADVAVQIIAKYGLGVPDILAKLGGAVAGNVWKRREMIRFARDVAKSGHPWEGAAIAIAGQWHNCHAFKCLIAHPVEVIGWLIAH
jgi:hypothetical protein